MSATKIELTNLIKTEPSRALFFSSMRCELKAANITKKTVKCLNDDDIRAASYRYLQNRGRAEEPPKSGISSSDKQCA